MNMITTDYINKFIDHTITKYIPEGIDPILHVIPRNEIKSVIMKLLENKQLPLKLSSIKLIIIDYKEILYTKYSKLN
jgi:hypothetical protein